MRDAASARPRRLRGTVTSNLARYQRIAPFYDLLDLPFEHGRYRKIRPQLFAGLSGRIMDAGVGTGRNFPFYPPAAKIIGIDLSPAMLARAARRLPAAAADVELRQMDVTRLDLPDHHFDAAVATFLFCVLPDESQVPALRELARVTKPGGLIRLLEYTRPRGAVRRAMTKLWDAEGGRNAKALRNETLVMLGGVQQLASTHVELSLGGLTEKEQALCLRRTAIRDSNQGPWTSQHH